MFVVTEITIKNVSDHTVEVEDLSSGDLINDEESPFSYYSYEGFEGELEPGESTEAKLIFDIVESSYYELVYGYAKSTVANEVRWRFEADDIE